MLEPKWLTSAHHHHHDQELVLGKLSLHRDDNDMNTRSVGIQKMTGTDDFDTEFPRFRGGRGCQKVRFEYVSGALA